MKLAGIVSEYNPFHNGHAFLISKLRQNGMTHIAVVMSGNFVQRGDTAFLSKNARTRQALLCGADLVVELPLPWALAGAEKFAFGGVSLLASLGADMIGFGSECGSVESLKKTADALSSPLLRDEMQRELAEGKTFAAARQAAVKRLFDPKTAELLREPNNILGIEYLKAIQKIGCEIMPFTVERAGTGHDVKETSGSFASSSQIRQLAAAEEGYSAFMPQEAWQILKDEIEGQKAPAALSRIETAILARLRTMQKEDFSHLPDISEGLGNRIYAASRNACSMEELYRLIKTKRYPLARIRRIVLSAFLNLPAKLPCEEPPYIRVLGINKSGGEILQRAKAVSKIPIISRSSDLISLDQNAKTVFNLENRAADLYALCQPKISPCGLDRTAGIIVL